MKKIPFKFTTLLTTSMVWAIGGIMASCGKNQDKTTSVSDGVMVKERALEGKWQADFELTWNRHAEAHVPVPENPLEGGDGKSMEEKLKDAKDGIQKTLDHFSLEFSGDGKLILHHEKGVDEWLFEKKKVSSDFWDIEAQQPSSQAGGGLVRHFTVRFEEDDQLVFRETGTIHGIQPTVFRRVVAESPLSLSHESDQERASGAEK